MAMKKFAAALTTAALLLSSTSAFAGEQTRSANSVPSLKALTAPVSGVRVNRTLKKKSDAVEALPLIILLGAGGAIITGSVIAATDNDSPG